MNLSKFLKNNNNARKIFGKRELKIIEKQLNGINLTQSEKNRLSRDIREKFKFIKNVSKFEEEFELKKGSEIKKIINEALAVILEHPFRKKIKKVLLFGSTVENKLTFKSDIDLAVLFNEISTKDATLFRSQIAGRVSDKIDIQVLNVLPQKIKESILKNHKVLYENGE